jgi:two-component system sensor histidine kinase/response regulator
VVPTPRAPGSRFYFTARFGLVQGGDTARHDELDDLYDLPILIVDDNASSRLILSEMLSSWRMKPVAVEGARQALHELERAAGEGQPYPLVLLDSQMPEMDGFTLAEQIRARPDLAGGTIMMLVSSDRQSSSERCRTAGPHACLMKPVKQSELLNTILDLLGARPSRPHRAAKTAVLQAEPQGGPPRAGVERPLRVLLAEDNIVNQRLAVRILEKRGHCTTVASNGKEVLALMEREPFDLVLMDLEMPEMSGFEATAAIRARERQTGRRVPILALTAHAMKGDRERCLAAGMDGYVAKPIQARELYQAIAKLVPSAATTDRESAPAPAVHDRGEALEHVGGDVQLLRELSQVFLQDCPRMMEEVVEGLCAADAAKVKRGAHSIKGAAGILGGKAAFEAAQRLEAIARQGDLSQAESAWQALRQALEQFLHVLLKGDSATSPPPGNGIG